MRLALLISLLLALPAPPLSAQVLRKGVRVRVTEPSVVGGYIVAYTGTLLRLENDTVVIGLPLPQAIRLVEGTRLEVASSRRHGAAGALIGGVLGGVGILASSSCTGSEWCFDVGKTQAFFFGAAVGGVVGLLVGESIRTETWAPVHTAGVRIGVGRTSIALISSF